MGDTDACNEYRVLSTGVAVGAAPFLFGQSMTGDVTLTASPFGKSLNRDEKRAMKRNYCCCLETVETVSAPHREVENTATGRALKGKSTPAANADTTIVTRSCRRWIICASFGRGEAEAVCIARRR